LQEKNLSALSFRIVMRKRFDPLVLFSDRISRAPLPPIIPAEPTAKFYYHPYSLMKSFFLLANSATQFGSSVQWSECLLLPQKKGSITCTEPCMWREV
jgi:hypothetical protein